MALYVPKVYRKEGGDTQVIASGGRMEFESGAEIVFPNPYGAQDYYVDGNADASGDGLSWATAYKTLAEAITASNTSIALTANDWAARRNRIFVCGETLVEDLTVLPAKCDIIGSGFDGEYAYPVISGNHTIAAAALSCRWINCGFIDTDGTADLFVIPANSHGISFLGCHFLAKAAGSGGKALEITTCKGIRIEDCIIGLSGAAMANIFAIAVSIEGTAIHDCRILRNHITATAGIAIVEAAAVAMGGLIAENIIRATDLAIDDNSDDFQVINNRWMTDVDTSTSTAGYDFSIALAAGNIQMGATGLCDTIPFTKIAE